MEVRLLNLLPADTDVADHWKAAALCAQTDPDAFFPEGGGSSKAARRVCGECQVRTKCLTEALANAEPFGVWGGFNESERRHIRRLMRNGRTQEAAVRQVEALLAKKAARRSASAATAAAVRHSSDRAAS